MDEGRDPPLTEKEESSLMEEVLSTPLSKEVDIKKTQWNKCKDGLKTYRTKYKEIQAQMKEEEKKAKAQIRLEYNRKIKQEMKGKKESVEPPPTPILQEEPTPSLEQKIVFPQEIIPPNPPLIVEVHDPLVEKIVEKEIPPTLSEKKRPAEEMFEIMEMYEEYKAKKNKKVPEPLVQPTPPSPPPVHENIARLVAPKAKTDSRLHVEDDYAQKFFFLRR